MYGKPQVVKAFAFSLIFRHVASSIVAVMFACVQLVT